MTSAFEPLHEIPQTRRQLAAFLIAAATQFARNIVRNIPRPVFRVGLPDVMPMQAAVMNKLQQQMMFNIEKVSPESLMQTWFTFDPKIAEHFQDMLVAMTGLGRSATAGRY